MTKAVEATGIKTWPEDDRPREKLFKSGEHTLSNTELLAIILRSGVKGQSAVDLSRKIVSKFKTFRNMSHTDLRDWKEFKGLGQAKIAPKNTFSFNFFAPFNFFFFEEKQKCQVVNLQRVMKNRPQRSISGLSDVK